MAKKAKTEDFQMPQYAKILYDSVMGIILEAKSAYGAADLPADKMLDLSYRAFGMAQQALPLQTYMFLKDVIQRDQTGVFGKMTIAQFVAQNDEMYARANAEVNAESGKKKSGK